MSLEREIKETLMDTADKVRPGDPSFEQVEGKLRARRARMAAIGTVSVIALLIGGVVAVPRLLDARRDPAPTFANPDDPTPEPSTDARETTAPVQGMNSYRNERDGYQTSFPTTWRVGEFEGAVEFHPKDLPGLPLGEDTFAVEIQHRIGENYADGEDGVDYESGHEVAGREAVRARLSRGDTRQTVYLVDWTGALCPSNADCDAETAMLRVMIYGSTEVLWDRYVEEGQAVVDALQTTPLADQPAGPVYTRRGVLEAGIEYDELTTTLVRFMDQRVEGPGAEPYLSAEAKKQYDAREGEFGLYGYGDPLTPWSRYTIEERAGVDANSAEFTVRIETGGEDSKHVVETIGVGAGERGSEIRFSQVQGAAP